MPAGPHIHKDCTVYHVAGYFVCSEDEEDRNGNRGCGEELHYSELGMKKDELLQYYDTKQELEEYVIDSSDM